MSRPVVDPPLLVLIGIGVILVVALWRALAWLFGG